MDKIACANAKNWHIGMSPNSIKNICHNCIDKDECDNPQKRTWDDKNLKEYKIIEAAKLRGGA